MSSNASSFSVGSNLSLEIGKILNVAIAAINTEQTISLPIGTKFFRIRPIGDKILKLSYTETESGTVYYNIYPHESHDVNGIAAASVKLYVQSTGLINIQIETWG
jgi:hypothetical protein